MGCYNIAVTVGNCCEVDVAVVAVAQSICCYLPVVVDTDLTAVAPSNCFESAAAAAVEVVDTVVAFGNYRSTVVDTGYQETVVLGTER